MVGRRGYNATSKSRLQNRSRVVNFEVASSNFEVASSSQPIKDFHKVLPLVDSRTLCGKSLVDWRTRLRSRVMSPAAYHRRPAEMSMIASYASGVSL